MSELSREYNQFINTRKKAVCRLHEQHEQDFDRRIKKIAEDEGKVWRQLEGNLKERLKQARKSMNRPKSIVGGGGFPGGDSPGYNDVNSAQADIDQLHKRLQGVNNVEFQQWKYRMLRQRKEVQVRCYSTKITASGNMKRLW